MKKNSVIAALPGSLPGSRCLTGAVTYAAVQAQHKVKVQHMVRLKALTTGGNLHSNNLHGRLVWLLVMVLTLSVSQHAFPLVEMGVYGKNDPQNPLGVPDWPAGLKELVNRGDRIDGSSFNGFGGHVDTFYYAGGADTLNGFLEAYAKLKDTPLTLILHPGKGLIQETWRQENGENKTPYDWQLVVNNRWNREAVDPKASDPKDSEKQTVPQNKYTVTVNLMLGGQIGLQELKVPLPVEVKSGSEMEKFIAAHEAKRHEPLAVSPQPAPAQPGPASDPNAGRKRLDQLIEMVRAESLEESLALLSEVELYYWPGYAHDGAFGYSDVDLKNLPRAAGKQDVERILSNRRWRKAYQALAALPQAKAAALVSTEITRTLPIYKKLFGETWTQLLRSRAQQAAGGPERSGAGPTLQISNNPDHQPTLAGARLKLLALVWLAGDLGLTDARDAVQAIIAVGLMQRHLFYNGQQATPIDRYLMLKDAGLYQRQILAMGLLGTSGVPTERIATEVKWEGRTIVAFDASLTEYDGIVGTNVDRSRGEFVVHYALPLDDTEFDNQIEESAPDLLAKAQFAMARSYFSNWRARSALPPGKDIVQARLEYTKVLNIKGLSTIDQAQALTEIAGCYVAEKQPEEAAAALTKVLGLKLDLSWKARTQMTIGDLYQTGNPTRARAEYSRVLEMGADDSTRQWALGAIARTYRREGNYGEERATHAKVLGLKNIAPERKAEAQIAIAQSYEAKKNLSQARAEYSKVLAIKDIDPYSKVYAHYLIAQSYLAEKNHDKARMEYGKVVEVADAEHAAPALRAEAEKQLKQLSPTPQLPGVRQSMLQERTKVRK